MKLRQASVLKRITALVIPPRVDAGVSAPIAIAAPLLILMGCGCSTLALGCATRLSAHHENASRSMMHELFSGI